LDQSQEREHSISHVTDVGECVLNYDTLEVVVASFVKVCARVDADCSTEGSPEHEHSVLVDSGLLLAEVDHGEGVEADTLLFGLTLTSRVASVRDGNDVDVQLVVDELEPVESEADVASVLVEENDRVRIL